LIDAADAFLGATFAETTFLAANFGLAAISVAFLVADFGVDFAVGTVISRVRLKLEAPAR
jgi:hypothetical protein